jgi:acetylornithine deacetylase/succinyl-diaminopimelate desuccinylase-like protein
VLAAVRTVHDGTGRQPAVRPWTFGTDGGHACGLHGVPTLGYAPGHESDAHTNHERLHLDSARVAYTIYPRLITALEQALMASVPLDAAVAF